MTDSGVCTTCGAADVEVSPMTEQCTNCDSEMDKPEVEGAEASEE